ncbi:unnamed protein product, partial [Vitis vinifera]
MCLSQHTNPNSLPRFIASSLRATPGDSIYKNLFNYFSSISQLSLASSRIDLHLLGWISTGLLKGGVFIPSSQTHCHVRYLQRSIYQSVTRLLQCSKDEGKSYSRCRLITCAQRDIYIYICTHPLK